MKNLISTLILASTVLLPIKGFSFCGFYVAKADINIKNETSEVILARKGNKTVVTMSNDFKGDVKDFAMVIPVPVLLQENDIKVIDRYIFDKLNTYTGPRLVEYYDQNPCYDGRIYYDMMPSMSMQKNETAIQESEAKELGVAIEAQYTVGEYDILILSAKESEGLKIWLDKNGYKIPANAEEVIEPYIKNKLKFFVAKVNLEEQTKSGFNHLRPIQITYESNRFMLPIRLGMANADKAQDLIIYAFSEEGQIETTNYRTAKIPTDKNIPTFIKDDFSNFYADVFETAYKRNNKNAVFLEYSWDLNSENYTKCDPCATTPPSYAELKDAGVFWVNSGYNNGWGGADYSGKLHITRLHVKYDRKNFPQDLFFQSTPNKQSFQGRYIMNHPVQEAITCKEAENYYLKVLDRRENELENLAYLTEWNTDKYDYYLKTYERKYERVKGDRGNFLPVFKNPFNNNNTPNGTIMIVFLSVLLLICTWFIKKSIKPKVQHQ
ncbi:MAG: DUF2330 domain-containing protein [Chitinophagales bacterium]